MIEFGRKYDSEYTIDVEDDIVEHSDVIVFEATDDGIHGEGRLLPDGDTMHLRLTLNGDRLEGTYEEWHETGRLSGSGVVSFEIDPGDGQIIGTWGNHEGSWSIVPTEA